MTERERSITVGRYQLHRKIARGGMATIHIAHLVGDVGFSRIVAAKRLHPELAQDNEFVAMFLDEARIASKVHHRNVVPVLDVVRLRNDDELRDEVILVQDFVHGVPLSWLQKELAESGVRIPIGIAVAIACHVLAGLHAAHETTDELGTPLQIVHRDVSPQNVMVATDGTARLLDFGVAKAAMAVHVTRAGMFKGKIAYAAPEQIRGRATRQSDIYAVAVVLWELLAGRRLNPSSVGQTAQIAKILHGEVPKITDVFADQRAWLGDEWHQLEALQQVLDRGLANDPLQRWATAIDMEAALASAVTPAPTSEISSWVKQCGRSFLEGREQMIAAEEASWRRSATQAAPLERAKTTAEQPPIGAEEPPPTSLRPSLWRHPALLLGGCALLGVMLALIIVFAGGSAPEAPRATAATQIIAPTSPERTVERPVVMPVVMPVVAPARVVAPAVIDAPPARTLPAPVRIASPPPRRASPSPPRPISKAIAKLKPVAPATPPPPAAAPDKKAGCSPPYYFEGDKKIFKASCL